MKYGEIISFAFSEAWKNKSIWLLGFLASMGGGAVFNLSPGDKSSQGFSLVQDYLSQHIILLIPIILFALFLFLTFFILSIISQGGLIEAAKKLRLKEECRLGYCFSVGVARFWPFLGLQILFAIVLIAFIIVLVLIGALAFALATALGIISLIFLIPIFLLAIFIGAMTVAFAQRMIVLDQKPVFDAIGDGFEMLRNEIGLVALFFIILALLSIGMFLATLAIMVPLLIPFIGIGMINVWLGIITGLPVMLIVAYLTYGYTGTVTSFMTTEFYFRLQEKPPSDGNTSPISPN